MKKQLGLLTFLVCATLATAQEVYTTWTGHKNVILNTAASGANVSSTVTAFPVLVRLGAADSNIFIQSVGSGADLRFTKTNNTTRLAHQIEKWDSAGKSAAIWVLVDTVRGNINNQSVRIHWGKSGAADSSSGSAVFQTSNGFQAVWHMNNGGTGTENDGTSNGFTATPSATAPTNNASGAIGAARTFNGSSSYLVALNTAASTLNFPEGGPFTLSAWINSTANGQKVILGKSDYTYSLQLNSGSNYEGCDFQSGQGWYCAASDQPPTGQWIHYANVVNALAESLYVNGVLVSGSPTLGSSGNARRADYNVFIGAMIAGTAPGTASAGTKSRYWNGSIDEVEMSSVARSSAWMALAFQNQQATQTLVSLSDTIPAFAVSPTITAQPASKSVAQGSTVKFGAAATASGTLTFKWVKNNTDTVRTVSGVAFDPLTLTNVLIADNNATYKAVVINSIGNAVSSDATLNVNIAAAIGSQPTAQNVTQGGTVKFAVTATGTNLTFKWVKNNTDTLKVATGVTSDTLTLTNVPPTDNSATYKVVISNPLNQVVSNSVSLTVVGILSGSARGSLGMWTSGHALQFRFPEGMPALRVSVMDLWGRAVWSHTVASGTREMTWNENNSTSGRTPSGIYLVRVALNSKPSSLLLERKILLTR